MPTKEIDGKIVADLDYYASLYEQALMEDLRTCNDPF